MEPATVRLTMETHMGGSLKMSHVREATTSSMSKNRMDGRMWRLRAANLSGGSHLQPTVGSSI